MTTARTDKCTDKKDIDMDTATNKTTHFTPADLRDMARLVARDTAYAGWEDDTPGTCMAEGETEWERDGIHATLSWQAWGHVPGTGDPADEPDGSMTVNVYAADAVAFDDDDNEHDISRDIDLGLLSQMAEMMA